MIAADLPTEYVGVDGHRWRARSWPRKPLHLAGCPCWTDATSPAPVWGPRRPRFSARARTLALRLFGGRTDDLDWNGYGEW